MISVSQLKIKNKKRDEALVSACLKQLNHLVNMANMRGQTEFTVTERSSIFSTLNDPKYKEHLIRTICDLGYVVSYTRREFTISWEL